MSDPNKESFLNDLDLSFEEAWKLLADGKKDRTSPLHTLVIGSVDPEGLPSQRVMVLRSIEPEHRILRFNTDRRAAKINDFEENSAVSILGYHPNAKVQLRLSGVAEIKTEGASFENAWDSASPYGKRCYLANPGPGQSVTKPSSGLLSELEGIKPSEEQLVPAKQNFAILEIKIDTLEWLYLAHTGHRRARFTWDHESIDWNGEWHIP